MITRVHRAMPAMLAALALASCRQEKPPVASAETPETPDVAYAPPPPFVTVTASDFRFDAPSELPAGLTTFRLVNHGPSIHHLQLVKLGAGKTFNDLLMALKAGGPPPKWLTMEGGPNPPELGDTASTTVLLEAGNYAMLCFVPGPDGIPHIAKGMVRPLTVTPAAGEKATEPVADIVMKLTDYDFQLSKPIPAGRHTIAVENAGPQEHEVVIVKLDARKRPIDFATWAEKQVGKAPGTLHGGTSGIMSGDKVFLEVNLEAGEYGLICFVPDRKDGKGHYVHGMVKKVRVG